MITLPKYPSYMITLPHSLPLDVILGLLYDQVDPLQHICDVIDPPLLHIQQL